MNKAFYLTVAAFVVIVLLTIWRGGAAAKNNKHIVEITSTGFSPKVIRIPKGTSVAFVNKDATDHWPASDFHPDHTIYPALDAKRPIKPGKSWIFRPGLSGVFRYHDHLFHYRKGTLTVDGPDKATDKKISSNFVSRLAIGRFRTLGEREKYAMLRRLISQKGTIAAWQFLNTTYPDTDIPTPEEHNLAHFMGRKFFEGQGIEGMVHCTPLFSYGCYDGITERALIDNLDALPQLESTCRRFGPAGSLLVVSCMHGLGHGIATLLDSLPLEEVLTACDRVKDYETSCHSGVFMDYDLGALNGTYPIVVTKNDPFSFCNSLIPKHRLACTGRMVYLMEKDYGFSFDKIVEICLGQKDQSTRNDCIESIGQREAKKANGNTQTIFGKCQQIPEAAIQNRCVVTALSETVLRQYNGWESVLSRCDQLTSRFQPECRKRVAAAMAVYQ